MKRFFKSKHKSAVKSPAAAEAGESPDTTGPCEEGWDDVGIDGAVVDRQERHWASQHRRPTNHTGVHREPYRADRDSPSSENVAHDRVPGQECCTGGNVAQEVVQLNGTQQCNYGNEDWFAAVNDQDLEEVQRQLDSGLPVDTKDTQGWTALHLCAWNDYAHVCDLLLRYDCDVNVRARGGCTPVSLAAERGHLGVTQRLLAAGCDLTLTSDLADSCSVTALHLAAQHGHVEVVGALVAAGAVVNATMSVRGIGGVTPLHLAVQNDHLDVMDRLINAGCDVHSSTSSQDQTSGVKNTAKESSC